MTLEQMLESYNTSLIYWQQLRDQTAAELQTMDKDNPNYEEYMEMNREAADKYMRVQIVIEMILKKLGEDELC